MHRRRSCCGARGSARKVGPQWGSESFFQEAHSGDRGVSPNGGSRVGVGGALWRHEVRAIISEACFLEPVWGVFTWDQARQGMQVRIGDAQCTGRVDWRGFLPAAVQGVVCVNQHSTGSDFGGNAHTRRKTRAQSASLQLIRE